VFMEVNEEDTKNTVSSKVKYNRYIVNIVCDIKLI